MSKRVDGFTDVDGEYLPITGGVLQGPLTVEGDINNTTGYVNDVEIYNLSTTYSANVNQSVTTTASPTFNNVTLTGALNLPAASGGLTTPLSYYEEYNFINTSFVGCGTSVGVSLNFTRIGRIVTCSSTTDAAFTATSSGTMSTGYFPSRFGVTTYNSHSPITVINAGTQTIADAYVNTTGVITVTGTGGGGNFTAGACTIPRFTMTWTLA